MIRHRERERETYLSQRHLESTLEWWDSRSNDPEFADAVILDALLRPVDLELSERRHALVRCVLTGEEATERDLKAFSDYEY
ncbi:MAG: hypothetical protein AB7F50_10270 [Fimbriimonadaceae bacterium]